jgi:hypothetical protein
MINSVKELETLSFVKNSKKYFEDNIPILEIPAGTIIFRGVPSTISDDDKGYLGDVGWFSDLVSAGIYAFRQDKVFGQPVQQADGGKIITFETTRDIRLFSLDDCGALEHLKYIIKDVDVLNDLLLILTCEDNQSRRISIGGADDNVAHWICKHTNLDGWGYVKTIGFHPEIMICNPDEKIKRLPLEYRYRMKGDIVLTYKGDIIGTTSRDYVGGVISSGKSYYKKNFNKQSDNYL